VPLAAAAVIGNPPEDPTLRFGDIHKGMASHMTAPRVDAIVAGLDRRREELARAMADAVLAEVPELAAVTDPLLRDEVLEHSREHIGAFIGCVSAGQAPTESQLEFVRARAAKRAAELVPLDALLHSYRIGQREVWRAIVLEAGADGAEAAVALSGLTITYTNAISNALAGAYAAKEHGAHVDVGLRRRDLLESLLARGADLGPEGARRAVALGLDLSTPHVAAIARPGDGVDIEDAAALVAARVRRARRRTLDPFVVALHEHVVALVAAQPGAETAAFGDEDGQPVRIGIGRAGTGLAAVSRSYEEARRALARTTAARPTVAYEDVVLLDHLAAAADELVVQTAREIAAPLVARGAGGAFLASTFEAFVAEDLSVTRTAARLYVHPNTVYYRLHRIAELTGRDPRAFHDAVELLLALRLATSED
jgi:PucR C-terminal helix-turn-helix domain/GGDEF-like domain